MNQYEQKKQKKRFLYDDMETRISETAEKEFRRKAYPGQAEHIRDMLTVKRNLIFLQNHAGLLDRWESEMIRRITARVKEESDTIEKRK